MPAPKLGIPFLPTFLCQKKAAHHLISGGKECMHRAQAVPPASKTACAPRGAGQGLEIIWGFQERTFSRRFCNAGQVQLQRCESPGAPHQLPASPRHIANCPRKWDCPISKTGRLFFTKIGENPAQPIGAYPSRAEKKTEWLLVTAESWVEDPG